MFSKILTRFNLTECQYMSNLPMTDTNTCPFLSFAMHSHTYPSATFSAFRNLVNTVTAVSRARHLFPGCRSSSPICPKASKYASDTLTYRSLYRHTHIWALLPTQYVGISGFRCTPNPHKCNWPKLHARRCVIG